MNPSTVPLIPNIRKNFNHFIRVSCIRPAPNQGCFPSLCLIKPTQDVFWSQSVSTSSVFMYSTPRHSFPEIVSRIPNTPNLHPQYLKLLTLLTQRLIPKRQAVTTNTLLKRVVQPQSIMPISTTNA